MNAAFFKENRNRLKDVCSNGIIAITGYTQMQLRADASAPFRQEGNFWYLTGIDEPDWWLLIDCARDKTWLVSPDVDHIHAVFDGSLSADDAVGVSGVGGVMSAAEAEEYMRHAAGRKDIAYTIKEDPHAAYYNFSLNPAPIVFVRKLETIFTEVIDCRKQLAALRAIKRPEELGAMRRAVALTVGAFDAVHQDFSRYDAEYKLEAAFTATFRSANAVHAYDPIVAAGSNACTLHYVKNRNILSDGDLVLMDVGAQVDGYAADVTRTYAYGNISARSREVHTAVNEAHHEIINLLAPGVSVREYHKSVDTIMQKALMSIGLIDGVDDTKYRTYFPHAISHGVGVDVHDPLGGPEHFQSGMVLTVEPGIYIPEEGIGVRIEDDILITETGFENLSGSLPTAL